MKTCLVTICLIAVCFAQTTNRPHATHEPNENESLTFAYNGFTHDLIVRQRLFNHMTITANCYIADLTPDEEKHVHSDAGMRSAELRVLQQLSSASMIADLSTIDDHNVHLCGKTPQNVTMHYYSL